MRHLVLVLSLLLFKIFVPNASLKIRSRRLNTLLVSVALIASPPPEVSWLPIAPSSIAHAALAPLADVGVREFLVKDGPQFLRLSIPVGKGASFTEDKESIMLKGAQESLELVRLRFEQVGTSNPAAWGAALKDAVDANNIVKSLVTYLISSTDPPQSQRILVEDLIPELTNLCEATRLKEIGPTLAAQEKAADALARLRLLELQPKTLPFKIPDEYANLPRLMGRARVEMIVESKRGFRLDDGKTVVKQLPVTVELDGYHFPLTAGNFVDLVGKKFYDNMLFQKVEELTVQTGRPLKGDGYVDPTTGETRIVPLELFYKKDKEPVYGITSDDDLRSTDTMLLPFQAYGAIGMARDNEEPDSGSSQFFLLKWQQALVAPGRNTLDGFYSCFGYVVSNNAELLGSATLQDNLKIVSAKVIQGTENYAANGK